MLLAVLALSLVLQAVPTADAAAAPAAAATWEEPEPAEVTALKACVAAIGTDGASVTCGVVAGSNPAAAECDFRPSWRQRGDCAVIAAEAATSQVKSQRIDCDDAMTMVDMTRCANERVAWETVRMEVYFRGAMISAYDYARQELESGRDGGEPHPYASQFIDDLQNAQSQWDVYAKTVCRSVGEEYRGGSIRPMMELGCLEELALERTRVIWAHSLGGADGDVTWPEPNL